MIKAKKLRVIAVVQTLCVHSLRPRDDTLASNVVMTTQKHYLILSNKTNSTRYELFVREYHVTKVAPAHSDPAASLPPELPVKGFARVSHSKRGALAKTN